MNKKRISNGLLMEVHSSNNEFNTVFEGNKNGTAIEILDFDKSNSKQVEKSTVNTSNLLKVIICY